MHDCLATFRLPGEIKRFVVKNLDEKLVPGTVVDFAGKHLTVLLCLELIRNRLKHHENLITIQVFNSIDKIPFPDIRISKTEKKYLIQDEQDTSGKTDNKIVAEQNYLPEEYSKLTHSFFKFLKNRLEKFQLDKKTNDILNEHLNKNYG